MKLLFAIVGIVLALAAFVWGATRFLAVDDLARCPARPAAHGECRKADAIVAISGGDTNARVAEAVALYKAGWAPKLIFSGAAQDRSGPSNAAAMTGRAISLGVPRGDITAEEFSVDTASNAQSTAAIARQKGLDRVILVTSAYHQRRAGIEFERAFGNGTAVLNHPAPDDSLWDTRTWWLTPSGWWLTMGELGKVIYISTLGR